jgi:hypothetical protein
LLRATAIPLAIIGLWGAERGPDYDIAIAATGESAAVRTADGQLTVLGARPSGFVSEQWLRADADPRAPKAAHNAAQCDGSGCSAELPDGRSSPCYRNVTRCSTIARARRSSSRRSRYRAAAPRRRSSTAAASMRPARLR